jgi:hypothetical protein
MLSKGLFLETWALSFALVCALSFPQFVLAQADMRSASSALSDVSPNAEIIVLSARSPGVRAWGPDGWPVIATASLTAR